MKLHAHEAGTSSLDGNHHWLSTTDSESARAAVFEQGMTSPMWTIKFAAKAAGQARAACRSRKQLLALHGTDDLTGDCLFVSVHQSQTGGPSA